MVKQLNVSFDDEEFARLKERKGSESWREFLLYAARCVPEYPIGDAEDINQISAGSGGE